jgi:hypothetical protein
LCVHLGKPRNFNSFRDIMPGGTAGRGTAANPIFTSFGEDRAWAPRRGGPGLNRQDGLMLKTIVLYLILGASLALQGCAGVAVAGVTAGTIAVDQKLPPDYIAGWIMDQDCSSFKLESTGKYCRTPEEIADEEAAAHPPAPVYYCYKTLGVVDCTAKPMAGEEARLMQ